MQIGMYDCMYPVAPPSGQTQEHICLIQDLLISLSVSSCCVDSCACLFMQPEHWLNEESSASPLWGIQNELCVCVCVVLGDTRSASHKHCGIRHYIKSDCVCERHYVCVLFWGTRVLHTNTVTLYTCYKIIIAIRCFKTKMIWHLNHLIYTAREVLSIDCQLLSLWATTVERCVVHKRVGSKSRFFVENEKSDFRWESRIFSCCCSCRQGRWARYIYSKDSKRSCTVQHKATERKGGKFGWISVILEAMKISIRARSTKNLHRHGGQLTLSLTPTDAGEVSCFDPSMSASTDLKETAGIPKQEHFFQNKWPQPNSWVLIRR